MRATTNRLRRYHHVAIVPATSPARSLPVTNDTSFGPLGHDFSPLIRCLEQFRDEELVFVPNPGNAGDALINLGMYKLFQDLGLRFQTGSREETYAGRVVVYSGGGALVPEYPGNGAFFEANHSAAKALILLPHTVRAYGDLIADMGSNCHLFAREENSFAYLQDVVTRANLALTHDLAFYLDDRAIAAMPWDRGFLMGASRRWSWPKMVAKFAVQAWRGDGQLNALRTDTEKTTVAIPSGNHDMSEMFASGDMSFGACASTIKTMRAVFRRYDSVNTNRLHIAVLSALVGLPVDMRDNSYGKNRDIHDHSIKGYFDNVTFHSA